MVEETPFRRAAPLAPVPPPSADNPKYEELLDRQIALADRQLEEIKREAKIRYWSPIVRHLSDVMKVTFEVAIGLGALVAVVIVVAAVWTASHEKGLVIEPFSVPADFSARGLTGQAVAAQMLDELSALQEATDTARPADSYSNNWGKDIKVEIPDTGVSIAEAYRLLVAWLGDETHITGEVFRAASGIAIRTRVRGAAGGTVKGAEADLDTLVRRSAEAIYKHTQPYRYAVYAGDIGRRAESLEVLQQLASDDTNPHEQAWAYLGLSAAKTFDGDYYGGIADLRRAVARFPDLASLYVTLDLNEYWLGHDEQALAAALKAVAALRSGRDTGMSERARAISLPVEQAGAALYVGDYPSVLRFSRQAIKLPDYAGLREGAREVIVAAHALLHDSAAADEAWRALPPGSGDPLVPFSRMGTRFAMNIWLGRWRQVLVDEDMVDRQIASIENDPANGGIKLGIFRKTLFWPYLAYAKAMTGDFKGAHALIDRTPLDCFLCLRVRGAIATAQKNWSGAQYWYERAVKAGPSLPAANTDWGRMLLAKGDPDGAIAKLRVAVRQGPRFADPLEIWGEALIAKNRSDLALAKFEQANRIAPNWGRLHLKWGEALWWLGQRNDARAEFAKAAKVELSSSERRELASWK